MAAVKKFRSLRSSVLIDIKRENRVRSTIAKGGGEKETVKKRRGSTGNRVSTKASSAHCGEVYLEPRKIHFPHREILVVGEEQFLSRSKQISTDRRITCRPAYEH